MRRIAFDAMGGDHAPGRELDAAVSVLREGKRDIGIILVGDEAQLRDGVKRRGASAFLDTPRLQLRHAPEVVTMEDPPAAAIRQKKGSSMRVAFELVKAKEADAIVSAGNSGAMLACGMFVLRRLPGTLRPGIVTRFPTMKGECALCDMGANVDVEPRVLAQFAVLGSVYAEAMMGLSRPRVGLLSNGEEAHKGTELTRGAHAILGGLKSAPFEYVGYVEGKDIFTGEIDVVATDGFTGNVVLKTSEGAALTVIELMKHALESTPRARIGALLAKPALMRLKKKLDYAETGGAPLLGVDGLVILSHGRSPAHALKNAIYSAARYVERGLVGRVAVAMERFEDKGHLQEKKA